MVADDRPGLLSLVSAALVVGALIHDYVLGPRLQRELRDGERSVLDIALACGFRQVTFFNRLFKREMGCTPVEYRKKQRRKGGKR